MSSYRFTPADRGPDGLIAIEPPAAPDLTPATPPTVSTARRSGLVDSQHWIVIAGVVLALVLIGLARYAVPSTAPAIPTLPATSAPTFAPTATPMGTPLAAALVAYFDYTQPDTATALDHGTRVQPIARIAHEWVLLQLADQSSVWVRWRDLPPSMRDGLPDRATPTSPPTATPAPTRAPIFAPPPAPAPPCTEANAQYRSAMDVRPYGRVVGISCVSQVEADAHAAQLAAQLRATAVTRR